MLKINMAAFHTSRKFDIIFLITLAALFGWAVANQVAISDKLFFLTHQPSAETIKIADDAHLTGIARTLLYRTDPQFSDLTTINATCDTESLGCLTPRGQAFVLDDPTRPNQTMVVAAHEMLHLAYRRLSKSKKAELAPLLDEAMSQNAIFGLEVRLQPQKDPEDRRDEAHSLLGTEYAHLPPQLETYYATYFTKRSILVTAAQSDH